MHVIARLKSFFECPFHNIFYYSICAALQQPKTEKKFHVELHFSPGAHALCRDLPTGSGFRPGRREVCRFSLALMSILSDNWCVDYYTACVRAWKCADHRDRCQYLRLNYPAVHIARVFVFCEDPTIKFDSLADFQAQNHARLFAWWQKPNLKCVDERTNGTPFLLEPKTQIDIVLLEILSSWFSNKH